MKKTLLLLTLMFMLFGQVAMAHVANEKTLYDDIEFSQAKEQIVYLRGIDAIAYESGVKLFQPQEILSKAELAFWAGTFKGLGGHDSQKEDVQNAVLEQGVIDALEGNATYADVNKAYFDGKADLEGLEGELTKEEFALFMGQFLTDTVDGKTLLDMAGAAPGPVGIIEQVRVEEEGAGEDKTTTYFFTVDGKEFEVSSHPKMLYGPVDLTQWEQKEIEDAWLITQGDQSILQIVALKEGQFTDDEVAGQTTEEKNKQTEQVDGAQTKEEAPDNTEETGGFPVVPVVGGIILIVIVGWLLLKKK
jgi:hypothetical protein